MPFLWRVYRKKYRRNIHIVLFAILTLLFLGARYVIHTQFQPQYIREVISKNFYEREQQLHEATKFLSIQPTTDLSVFTGNEKKWEKQGFAFFLYKNDSLKAWSTQNIDPPKENVASLQHRRVVAIGDGYYTPCYVAKGDTAWLGLALVQYDYDIENEYLINSFHDSYGIDENIPLVMTKTYYNVYDENDEFLFGLDFSSYRPHLSTRECVCLFLVFFLWLLLLNTLLRRLFRVVIRKPWLQNVALIVAVVVFRVAQMAFRFPEILYQSDLFQPFWYANSFWFPSLGDMCLNAVLFVQLCYFLMQRNIPAYRVKRSLKRYPVLEWVVPVGCFVLVYAFLFLIANLYRSLVWDALLDISLRGLFTQMPGNLFLHSAICLLSLVWVMLSWYMVFLGRRWQKKAWRLVLCQIPGVIMGIWLLQTEYPIWLSIHVVIFGVLLLLYFSLFHFRSRYLMSGTFLLIVPFILSGIASLIILNTQIQKKQVNSELILSQISSLQDPIAEFLFSKMENEIVQDPHLKKLLMEDTEEDSLRKYMKDEYFQDYWDKYVVDVMTCRKDDRLRVGSEDSTQSCAQFFKRRIKYFGQPTSSSRLYLLNETLKQTNYVAEFSFNFDNYTTYLYIEFSEKTLFDDMGYPDLLMDKFTKDKNKRLNEYSHALYENGLLMRQGGSYAYTRQIPETFVSGYGRPARVQKDGYNHYVQSQPNGKTWVLSYPVLTLKDRSTTLSYLFVLHVFFLLCAVGFADMGRLSWTEGSFKNRIQYSIVLLVIITTTVLAFRSVDYIKMVNQKKYENLMIDKARSIAVDLEPFFEQNVSAVLENAVLYDSYLFYTDVNVFDAEGKLWVTSRPEIYNEHLISTLMHPQAFAKIKSRDLSVLVQQESIGNQHYQAIYMPIHNAYGQTMAFLHLPSFSQQTQLESEVIALLTSYANIYVLLFILAIGLTLILSAWLTYPLQQLQRYMPKVQLGRKNEKIKWNRKDEIGRLINEYNSMVDHLENHAYMLAKSEREGAWRNMAKQVAHEIKNPLTPMKLSIQMIQRLRKENPEEFNRRYDEFSASLIEQIDTIANIVSTLSDIAKVHTQEPKLTDLISCVKKVVYLYNNDDTAHVTFDHGTLTEAFIMGNSDQMTQVINNLLKNASQSVKEGDNVDVWIVLKEVADHYRLEVADNGMGISEKNIDKVFFPNFTTKTFGNGIGLALVKSIIESFNGTITCTSQEGEGAVFIITLPKTDRIQTA